MRRFSRRPGPVPALQIVSLVSAGIIAGCSPDWDDSSTRVCRTAQGLRAPDATCERGSSGGSHGGGFVYLMGNRQAPAIGAAVGNYRAEPGNGAVRGADGRVVRGGLGMSAHSSAGE